MITSVVHANLNETDLVFLLWLRMKITHIVGEMLYYYGMIKIYFVRKNILACWMHYIVYHS